MLTGLLLKLAGSFSLTMLSDIFPTKHLCGAQSAWIFDREHMPAMTSLTIKGVCRRATRAWSSVKLARRRYARLVQIRTSMRNLHAPSRRPFGNWTMSKRASCVSSLAAQTRWNRVNGLPCLLTLS